MRLSIVIVNARVLKMNCSRFRRLIPKYLDGQLAEDDARRVRAHLDACIDCRAEADSARRILELLAEWPAVEPRLGFGALQERLVQRTRRSTQPVLPVPSWAAAALAVLSIGVGAALGVRPAQHEPPGPLTEAQVASAVGLVHYDDLIEASLAEGMGAEGAVR
ncbi:MAG: zf-HC2 domain-containing protein [Armatimonadota bacterium]